MSQPAGPLHPELEQLFAKRPSIIKPGLERIRRAWEALQLASNLAPCILIGGTNGKGSTSGMLWHLLSSLKLRVGLFTSPHLCHFHERIQCTHLEIDNELLIAELRSLQAALEPTLYESLSFFEVTTLLALSLFKKVDCQMIVLEVGLGGRWDSTNIVEPLASAVVSIDLDHEAWLGHRLEQIAFEKLGIARPKRPLFWGERHSAKKPGVASCLIDQQASLGFELYEVSKHFAYLSEEQSIRLSLPGLPTWQGTVPEWFKQVPSVLRHNFALSLALFYWLLHQKGVILDEADAHLTRLECLDLALKKFAHSDLPWPPSLLGRFQSLEVSLLASKSKRSLRLDVCHNPASTLELQKSLQQAGLICPPRQKIPALVSILADKDLNSMLDLLKEICEPLIVFQVASDRTLHHNHLASRHQHLSVFSNFAEAWKYALEHWQNEDLTGEKEWLICGSFVAVGEVIHYFSAYPLGRLLCSRLQGVQPE